jgi:hypothetical protein
VGPQRPGIYKYIRLLRPHVIRRRHRVSGDGGTRSRPRQWLAPGPIRRLEPDRGVDPDALDRGSLRRRDPRADPGRRVALEHRADAVTNRGDAATVEVTVTGSIRRIDWGGAP